MFGSNNNIGRKIKFCVVAVLSVIIFSIFFSSFFDGSKKSTNEEKVRVEGVADYAKTTELRLQNLLSNVKGINNVCVFVYVKSTPEIVYKYDIETVSANNQTTTEKHTTVFDKNGSMTEAVIVVTKYPQIEGVMIVASGAGDPKMKLKLIDAVSCVLSIAPTKIEVLEGKS